MEQDHMLQEPPSYTQSHDPQTLDFPTVPSTDLTQIHHERTLPPLPSAHAEQRYRQEPPAATEAPPFVWPSSNPLTAYYQPGPSQLSPKDRATSRLDSPSLMDIDSQDRGRRGASVLSIDKDDMDVRIAAEALGELRADFVQSPSQNNTSLPNSSQSFSNAQNPEPLLSLLTTSHPLIGTAIGGSLSAYSASKNYSPRFKSGAEYVEKRFSPVVNTVGSVGRFTGVEGGVRWFLGGRRPSHNHPSDLETTNEEGSHKRRKLRTQDQDFQNGEYTSHDLYNAQRQDHQRRASQVSTVESLPAYDDYRSPSYEAAQTALITTQPPESPSWQSRLVQSTSGLSIAMSDESLRSLKYCLSWLRWANEHIGKVILALKSVLDQYDPDTSTSLTADPNSSATSNQNQLILRTQEDRNALTAKIAALKQDVLKTLKEVVDIVSKYAGGALPENARELVRKHLTSLPQRFRAANAHSHESRTGDGGEAEGARRVLVLAREGLDMMAQVSGVLDGTIVSAEEWCERLGKRRREDGHARTSSQSRFDAESGTNGKMDLDVLMAPLPPAIDGKDIDGRGFPRPPPPTVFSDVKMS